MRNAGQLGFFDWVVWKPSNISLGIDVTTSQNLPKIDIPFSNSNFLQVQAPQEELRIKFEERIDQRIESNKPNEENVQEAVNEKNDNIKIETEKFEAIQCSSYEELKKKIGSLSKEIGFKVSQNTGLKFGKYAYFHCTESKANDNISLNDRKSDEDFSSQEGILIIKFLFID